MRKWRDVDKRLFLVRLFHETRELGVKNSMELLEQDVFDPEATPTSFCSMLAQGYIVKRSSKVTQKRNFVSIDVVDSFRSNPT